jgi:hypothetical protein
MDFGAIGGSVIGSQTAAAGTAFYGLVPGNPDGRTRVTSFSYTASNTAHTVTALRPIGRTTLAAACVVNTNTVTLAADPGPSGNGIAANDQIVIHYRANTNDRVGTYGRHTVSAWNATTKVATISPNTTAASISGTKVFDFGIFSDTDPVTGAAHPGFPTNGNTVPLTYTFPGAGIAAHQYHDPILLHSGNATGAGTLTYAEYAHTKS